MKGFTLVELLVVLAISAMLSAIAITYTGMERNQIALSVETAKVAGLVLQAKSLSITTYAESSSTCAYGVSFNISADTYSIFAFDPDPSKYGGSVPPCPDEASVAGTGIAPAEMVQYSPDTWNVSLANGVHLQSGGNGDDLAVVLFYPPEPVTLISRDGTHFLDPQTTPDMTSAAYFVTGDGSSNAAVSVNAAGQISF